MKRNEGLVAAVILLCLPFLGIHMSGDGLVPSAEAETTYLMRSSVIGAGGSPGKSVHFSTNGTLGQPTPIGIGSENDLTLYAGFWGRYWIPTGTDETPTPYRTDLRQNYPNPFNPATTIEYSVARAGLVEIAIFDVSGRRVAMPVAGWREPGTHRGTWDGRNEHGQRVASGFYFCRMSADSKTIVKKMILLR